MPISFDITVFVVAMVLTLRISILAALLPLISGRTVPVIWRLALAGVIAAACAPTVAMQLPPGPLNLTWGMLVMEALHSFTVGILISFVLGIPFAAVRFAGQIIGVQIGFSMVNTVDPQGGAQVTVLAQLYYLMAVILFFALDIHHLLIRLFVESCYIAPIFGAVDGRAGAWFAVSEFGEFFKLGFIVASPVVIVLLLVSAAMGFVVKTVPQINILVVGFPIKIAVGLAVFGASLVFFSRIFTNLILGMEDKLMQMMMALSA